MNENKPAQLRAALSSPAIADIDHLRKLALSCLDELEDSLAYIASLEDFNRDADQLIADLKHNLQTSMQRTVTVKLPEERFRYGDSDYDDGFVNGWNAHGIETRSALAAAGISIKGSD
jgi:hypothetical protein